MKTVGFQKLYTRSKNYKKKTYGQVFLYIYSLKVRYHNTLARSPA